MGAFVSPLTKPSRVFSLRIVQIKAEREFKLVTLYGSTVKKWQIVVEGWGV